MGDSRDLWDVIQESDQAYEGSYLQLLEEWKLEQHKLTKKELKALLKETKRRKEENDG